MDEMNGSDTISRLMIGQLVAAKADEQIRLQHASLAVMERIQDDLQELPYRFAAALHAQAPRQAGLLERLGISRRELFALATVVMTGVAALLEGASFKAMVQAMMSAGR